MTTLYVRDVPEETAALLKERAAKAGMSVSAYVAGELTRLVSRPSRAEMLTRLRSRDRTNGPTTEQILAAVHEGRR